MKKIMSYISYINVILYLLWKNFWQDTFLFLSDVVKGNINQGIMAVLTSMYILAKLSLQIINPYLVNILFVDNFCYIRGEKKLWILNCGNINWNLAFKSHKSYIKISNTSIWYVRYREFRYCLFSMCYKM